MGCPRERDRWRRHEEVAVFQDFHAKARGEPVARLAILLIAVATLHIAGHEAGDQHNNLPKDLPNQCRDIDQPTNALLTDLKERGLLDDTLVVWGGEFGRTIYCQGKLTRTNYGRDHHPKCFTMWMAGAGIKGGVTHGITDDFSYNVVMDPVHIRDINATILQQLGLDHELLSIKYRGRERHSSLRVSSMQRSSQTFPVLVSS